MFPMPSRFEIVGPFVRRRAGGVFLSLLSVGLFLGGVAVAQKPPGEELAALRAAPGFEVSLFASEPMITNPSAIDVDTHGRVWVAEIQFYRGQAKQPGADKIKVLEDTDGDGRADKMTVFAEGLFAPMSVCVAGDKVYVATSPDLWVYEDKDGDLKADGPPKKLLTGFGGFNHDHGAHSLVLGPDHKWWMSHGDTGFDVKGTDGSQIKFRWGAMLRGELDGSKLETVAVNFRNPYEICVNSFGESYVSDNDNDGNQSARICWILEGGDYGWFGGPPARAPAGTPFGEHWHFRGHIPGFVPATLVTGFGSPCGMCFYEGDAFGEKYKNAPLHCDPGPREVRLYRHQNQGFGQSATSEVFLTSQGDDYFRPDDICAAPDGSLYVSDWYDGGVGGHAYNNPDQGRIFLLRPAGKKTERVGKPGPYSTIEEAVAGLQSPNLATQYLARERLIAEGQKSVSALRQLIEKGEPNFKARALWLADRIGGEARQLVREQLGATDPTFRALAVRILRRHGKTYFDDLAKAAGGEAPAEVQREFLLGLAGLTGVDENRILDVLEGYAKKYDGSDRYLLEILNVAAGGRKPQLYARLSQGSELTPQTFALLQLLDPKGAVEALSSKLAASGVDAKTAAVLLAAAGTAQDAQAGKGLLKLLASKDAPLEVRRLALEKLSANLSGPWNSLAEDEELVTAFKAMLADGKLQSAALKTIGERGLSKLGGEVLQLATGPGPAAGRLAAIAAAVKLNPEGTSQALRELLKEGQEEIRTAALQALVDLQDLKTVRDVLSGEGFSAEARSATANRLLESTGGALSLLKLIEERKLATELRQSILEKAAKHADSNVRVLFEQFLPPEQRPKRLGEAIKAEEILALSGDPGRGKEIFHQSTAAQCKNCHTTDGSGTLLGPDLALIGKKYERAALLETILQPSKAISHEYVPYLLETARGQFHLGFVVEKTDKQVVLKDAKAQLTRVDAAEVESLTPQTTSVMPELVLRDVTAQDAADLLAYLTTLRQGMQSVTKFRVLGPIGRGGKAVDHVFEPEKSLEPPDFNAEYASGMGNQKVRWEVAASDGALGFAGIDTVQFDRAKKMRSNDVVHYLLVYADSLAEQPAELLIGSDDGCKVWLNGREIHKHDVTRALGFGQDRVTVKLKQGRNLLVMKVVNGGNPGGASLAIKADTPVELKVE